MCVFVCSIIGTFSKGRRNDYFVLTQDVSRHFFYTTCIHKMMSKVHLTVDFSAKEAGINLKLAECIQKTYINLNPQLHKSWPNVLKCVF